MQVLLLVFFVASMFTASGLAVAHYRRANRGLDGELRRYAQLEAQLRDSKERYRTLFELAPVGCVVWEPGFKVTEWNDQAERIFGWTREEMLGRNLYEALLGEKGVKARRDMAALFADGRSTQLEIPMTTKHGKSILCQWRNAVLRTPDGRPAKIVSTCADITLQKALEEERIRDAARREREQNLLRLAAAAPGLMFTLRLGTDGNLSMPYASPVIRELLGLEPEDLVESLGPLQAAILPDDRALVDEAIANSARSCSFCEVEFRIAHPEKGELWMEARSMPTKQADGGLLWHGFMLDITGRKQAQRHMELLERAIDLSADAVYLVDQELRFGYVNAAACRALGYSGNELLAMGPTDIDPDADRETILGMMREAAAAGTGSASSFETRHRARDGRVFPVELTATTFVRDGAMFSVVIARDITQRKLIDNTLRFIADLGWSEGGDGILSSLARHLGETLAVDYVIIDRLSEEPGIAETVALYAKGDIVPNMRYPLQDTPCDNVMGKRLCCYPEGVQALFPKDALLADMGVESYAGIPLWDSTGKPIGLIALLDSSPVRNGAAISQMLQLVATRAAAELEHQRYDRLLRARESEFRTLVEHSPDVVVRYGPDFQRLYVNPAWERANGISVAEVMGKTPVERAVAVAPFADEYQEKLRKVMESGQPADIDLAWKDEEGQPVCYAMRAVPEFNADGSVAGVLTVARDVTERRRMEAELAAREREFRILAESLPDNLIHHDRQCRALYLNPAMARTLSLASADAVLGLPPGEVMPGLDAMGAYEEVLRRVLEQGGYETLEISIPGPGGEMRNHQIRFAPTLGEGDEITGALAIGTDITERKRYEAELSRRAALERQLSVLAANVPGFIYTLRADLEGHATVPFASPGVEEVFGLRPEDIRGDAAVLRARYHPDDLPRVLELVEQTQRTLGPLRIELRILHPEKGQRWIDIRSTPQRQPDGATEWHGLMIDVTERKRLEQALARSEREFRSLAESLPDNVARWDTEGRMLYCNPVLQRTLGKPVSELIGRTNDETFPDGRYAPIDAAIEHIVTSGGEALFLRQPAPGENGGTVIHDIKLVPEFDETGKIAGVLGVGRDMTEAYRLENSLREQKEFQEILLNGMNEVGMQLMVVEEGRIVHVSNRKLAAEFGYSPADLEAGVPLEDIIHPDDRERVIDYYRRRLAGEDAPFSYELGLVTRGGERREYEVSVAVVPGTNPLRIVSVGKDIAERKQYEAVLRAKAEAEARLSKLAATAPGAVAIVRQGADGSFSLPYAAPGIVDVFGLLPDKLAGDAAAIHDRIHPDDLPRFRESLAASAQNMAPWHCEYRAQNPARGEVWVETRAVPEPGPGGDILWYGFFLEITPRKQAQERFEMANFALDNVEEAAFLVDGVWIVHANGGACRALGYEMDEFKGATVFDFAVDFDKALLDTVLDGLAENGHCVFETRYKHKRGGVFPVEISVAAFEFQGREMRLFLARSIAERKRVEELLRMREREFRALVENSPDTIARYDRACRRLYINPAVEKRLGQRGALGKTPSESADYPAVGEYEETIREVLESGSESEFRLKWRSEEGAVHWSHIRLVPEANPEGEVVSVLAVGRDITALVDAEEHLEESRRLLRKLAFRRETEHEKERQRLAWEVYDTLGQLLMVQRMDVSHLRDRFAEDLAPFSCHLKQMLSTTDRAIQVMRNVAYELRPVTLDMGVTFALEWLVEEFRKNTGVPCEFLVDQEEILLDETGANMLFRIAEESLDNIARHAGASYVEIELGRRGDEYLLEIRDNGKGFDLDQPMEKSLGLFDIRERVLALGGEMVLLSVPGKGTVVEVRIPVRETPDSQLDLWEE